MATRLTLRHTHICVSVMRLHVRSDTNCSIIHKSLVVSVHRNPHDGCNLLPKKAQHAQPDSGHSSKHTSSRELYHRRALRNRMGDLPRSMHVRVLPVLSGSPTQGPCRSYRLSLWQCRSPLEAMAWCVPERAIPTWSCVEVDSPIQSTGPVQTTMATQQRWMRAPCAADIGVHRCCGRLFYNGLRLFSLELFLLFELLFCICPEIPGLGSHDLVVCSDDLPEAARLFLFLC